MKNKRTLILSLAGLLSGASLSVPLEAQKKAVKGRGEVEKIRSEVKVAEDKDLPTTLLSLSDKMLTLGEKRREVSLIIEGLELKRRSLNDLRRYDAPDVYQALDSASKLSWLSKSDQFALGLYALGLYYDKSQTIFWGNRRNQRSDSGQDSIVPTRWSSEQYAERFDTMLKEMMPHALKQGATKGEYMLFGSDERQRLSAAHALYASVGQSGLAQRFGLTPSLLSFLSEYKKSVQEEAEHFLVDFALYRLEADGKMPQEHLQAQTQLVEKYQHNIDVLPHVYQLASLMDAEGDTKGAVALLDKFILRFGLKNKEEVSNIRELRKDLLQPTTYIEQGSDNLIARRDLRLKFRYKHLKGVRAKVYKLPSVYDPERLDAADSITLSRLTPIAEEGFVLQDSERWGYSEKEVSLTLPSTGLYHIVFEPTAQERGEGEPSASNPFGVQVTDKFVVSISTKGGMQYRWLDARTGKPLENLEVELKEALLKNGSSYDEEGKRLWSEGRHLRSSSEGLIQIGATPKRPFWLRSMDEADPYSFIRNTYFGIETSELQSLTETKSHVYTDRSIYLPGQRVQIAGTLAQISTASERNRVLASREIVVEVFAPRGGDALYTERLRTDSFGRFNCSFDVPKTGLLGNARVSVRLADDKLSKNMHHVGQAYFEIAEYKRPTFELEMTRPRQGYALGDTIDVSTQVKLFSGGVLSDVELSYEVYHSSHSLWRMPSYRSETLIHTERLVSNADGMAILRLPLTLPKDMQRDKRYPDYNIYRIVLRATAPFGEQQTRTLTINVGNRLGDLSLNLPEFIDQSALNRLEPLRFAATSFDGDTLQLSVQYELYSSDSTMLSSGAIDSNVPVSLSSLLGKSSLGRYRVRYFVKGDSSRLAEEFKEFTLYSSKTKQIDAGNSPVVLFAGSSEFEQGKPVDLFYSSALDSSYVFYTVFADGKSLSSGLLRPRANYLEKMTLPLKGDTIEEISADFYTVRQGRLYSKKVTLNRKQQEKKLELRWETFRDRVRAGSKETWRLCVLKDGRPVSSALSAFMYDASLDDISPYHLGELPSKLNHYYPRPTIEIPLYDRGAKDLENPNALTGGYMDAAHMMEEGRSPIGLRMAGAKMAAYTDASPIALNMSEAKGGDRGSAIPRTNFSETAFFYPTLQTDKKGRVSWTFTIPESLTRWRLHFQAHTEDLYKGYLSSTIETYKELSVRPLMPRFALSGDSLTIATSIHNTSSEAQQGTFVFSIIDPSNGQKLKEDRKTFDLSAGASLVVESAFVAPKGLSSVVIRTTAEGKKFSDGEQHLLKILPLERENIRTKALTLKGKKNYSLSSSEFMPKGLPAGVDGQLNVSFEANPFYLTLGSLPRLGGVESECSIDLSAALYAQGVARRIKQDTQLMSWIGSRLSKDSIDQGRDMHLPIKSVETPWSAQLEAEGSKTGLNQLNSYLLSDLDESAKDLTFRLKKLQHADGSWAWFAGMNPNRRTHQTVLSNLVRLEQMGGDLPESLKLMINKGWDAEHENAKTRLKELEAYEQKHSSILISSDLINYAYLLALSPRISSQGGDKAIIARILKKLQRDAHRLSVEDKARAAIALGQVDRSLALELVRSLKEHLSTGDAGELFVSGDRPAGPVWYSYSFSSTIRVLEAIYSLDPSDVKTIEGIKQWILQQKRGQSWGSSLSTAEAVYVLALGGESAQPNELSLTLVQKDGKKDIAAKGDHPNLMQKTSREAIPSTLKIESGSPQTLWGISSIRYTAPLTDEVPFGEELKIERRYYIRTVKDGKPYLRLAGSGDDLRVGDRMVVQIYIKAAQTMDFVRLSDPRLGFAEPVEQVASYKREAGVGYYVEPRDVETNFYFDTLRAGEYRLEYEQSVVRSGKFHMPQASIQSVYAPEYSGATGYSGEALILPAVRK